MASLTNPRVFTVRQYRNFLDLQDDNTTDSDVCFVGKAGGVELGYVGVLTAQTTGCRRVPERQSQTGAGRIDRSASQLDQRQSLPGRARLPQPLRSRAAHRVRQRLFEPLLMAMVYNLTLNAMLDYVCEQLVRSAIWGERVAQRDAGATWFYMPAFAGI